MSFWQVFGSTWNWSPSVLIGCEALLVGYAWLQRFKPNVRWLWFLIGDLLLAFALVSPLDRLGDQYLFSVHMLQHLLLMLLVPPFLLAGLPPQLVRKGLNRWRGAARLERGLSRPLTAWVAGIGTMWLWHIPFLYEAALQNEAVHVVQHLAFLVTSTIFWWPVIGPVRELRIKSLLGIIYLFLAGAASSLLGIILTFMPAGLYPTYLHPIDSLNLLPAIQGEWGISPAVDQQLGGIFMWVFGGLSYVGVSLGVLARWFSENEREEIPGPVGYQPASLKTGVGAEH